MRMRVCYKNFSLFFVIRQGHGVIAAAKIRNIHETLM